MGVILAFPKQPERGDGYLWLRLENVIEGQVKRDGRLSESAPEAIAQRVRRDCLRWFDRVQESSGETQEQLLELFAAALVDRVDAEIAFEHERNELLGRMEV